MSSLSQQLCKIDKIIKKSDLIEDGNPARYRLQASTDSLDQFESYRKRTVGEREKNKPHKTILMVGETGAGKTTLINAMINYMLGVQREDKVWFEITDDQSDRTQAHSQTSSVTVYGFYPQESPKDLTIIDTPGYGDTRGTDLDKEIAVSLLNLSKSAEEIHEIHAVCLVMMAQQNRLSDRQQYIFDAVQSLFGRDIAENIVLLFTHSDGMPPKDALTAVKEAKIKCALNDKNQPVFFLFNNCQSYTADEEYETIKQHAWDLSFRGMAQLFTFLETAQTKTLKMTQTALQEWKQLEAKTLNLKTRIQDIELKQNELKQTQAALEQNKKDSNDISNSEHEVDVVYKEKIDIDPNNWILTKKATCCSVCEENCHYPGCWWVRDCEVKFCEVMKHGNCTVCTERCHYSKHVKEAKIYVTKTRREKKTCEELKKKYADKIMDDEIIIQTLKDELQKLEENKVMSVNEAFHCVETLQKTTLNINSMFTLQHIDFLIEKLKEIHENEKAETLKVIKKTVGEEKRDT